MPHGFSPGDARGEAPCIRKLKVSPFPPGRGAGGWGKKQSSSKRQAGDQNRHAPRRVPERHPSPPRKGQSPTPGTRLAGFVSAARVQPRGCKGRSPLHKITLKSPPSRREGGVGGMGAENQAKGKVGRRQRKHATRRGRGRQGEPVPRGASPPAPRRVPQRQG